MASSSEPLQGAAAAVLQRSDALPAETPQIRGYDFNEGVDYNKLLEAMLTTGKLRLRPTVAQCFQATNFGQAIEEINRMLRWRLSDEPIPADADGDDADPEFRKRTRCKIFLGYTSNLISAGVREVIRYLVQHRMVDCLVTTAGGIEEDLIKCLRPTFVGDFALDGKGLRQRGLNRIGNLLVPNDNYCAFEDWVNPILDTLLKEQTTLGAQWTPSRVIERLGREIDNPDSVCYWAARNGIPIFCPALTDGSLGDMLYFHSYRSPGLVIDIVADIRAVNDLAMKTPQPRKTGMIVLGGGVCKHHVANANLMRNGADFAVYVNTAQEFDGSDSGARPDEAISWGKIRPDARPIKARCALRCAPGL